MKILVLQHCPVTPVGLVGEVLQDRGAELDTRMPHHGEAMPDSPAGYDGLVVLGGPQHAGDDVRYPAFPPMLALIRQFHDQAKPVLGVCLGAQLIARAFGGTVWPFGDLEIGYLPVRQTPTGRRDPLLKGMPIETWIMQLHEDSFDLPSGAVRLMTNAVCANQAIRVGRTTYGFQFHFEVTKGDAVNFPRDCWGSLERHYGELAELVADDVVRSVEAHFEEGAGWCRTLTGRWLDLVAERHAWAEKPQRVRKRA
ncbi:MAG TPA: type 1 glutamine amidotransferase [Dongiaceae bacterium]|jgi:GMP synthase-like glutamine amidotransferase|nr:type 1 glutamine amidotransferase [Dongiaceae bacterium]